VAEVADEENWIIRILFRGCGHITFVAILGCTRGFMGIAWKRCCPVAGLVCSACSRRRSVRVACAIVHKERRDSQRRLEVEGSGCESRGSRNGCRHLGSLDRARLTRIHHTRD